MSWGLWWNQQQNSLVFAVCLHILKALFGPISHGCVDGGGCVPLVTFVISGTLKSSDSTLVWPAVTWLLDGLELFILFLSMSKCFSWHWWPVYWAPSRKSRFVVWWNLVNAGDLDRFSPAVNYSVLGFFGGWVCFPIILIVSLLMFFLS